MAKTLLLVFLLAVMSNASMSSAFRSNVTRTSIPLVSWANFSHALTSTGYSAPHKEQYDAFIHRLPNGNITTKLEAAMFLAQIIIESGGLRYKRELRCIKTGCPGIYDSSVGVPGKNYYGRGYIQLTHSYNYKEASLALYGDLRLIKDPDMVARDEDAAWATAFWYWKVKVHSRPGVMAGHFGDATMAINGGLCKHKMAAAHHRFEVYKKVVKAFEIKEKPNGEGCW